MIQPDTQFHSEYTYMLQHGPLSYCFDVAMQIQKAEAISHATANATHTHQHTYPQRPSGIHEHA